jgi:hypothetical protein
MKLGIKDVKIFLGFCAVMLGDVKSPLMVMNHERKTEVEHKALKY